jgi:hypothetical protein
MFEVGKAKNLSVLHAFTATAGDGKVPPGGLVADDKGNLFGRTERGGNLNCSPLSGPRRQVNDVLRHTLPS